MRCEAALPRAASVGFVLLVPRARERTRTVHPIVRVGGSSQRLKAAQAACPAACNPQQGPDNREERGNSTKRQAARRSTVSSCASSFPAASRPPTSPRDN